MELFESKWRDFLFEIQLNTANAVPTTGDIDDGSFEVGGIRYNYKIENRNGMPNIGFEEEGLSARQPTGNAGRNIFKIYATIAKVINDYLESELPYEFSVVALDESPYFSLYNRLLKSNNIAGYSLDRIDKINVDSRESDEKLPAKRFVLKRM